MQLTKDDVGIATTFKGYRKVKEKQYLDFSKFLKVRKFYEDYESKPILFGNDHMEKWELFVEWHNQTFGCKPSYRTDERTELLLIERFNRWLFYHLFKEGFSETIDDHPVITPEICKKITKGGLK